MKKNGEIRIIGGQWRGRKIAVPDEDGVRPTPDRIRETLFNWLTPHLRDANCLDAYAGTGVLGFECLSRGAKSVTFVDSNPAIIKHLEESAELLKTTAIDIVLAKFPRQFTPRSKGGETQFNVVFLDPPFSKNYLPGACHFLEDNHLLAENCLIYIECEVILDELDIPDNWDIIKQQEAGEVQYCLIKRN
ncbi:MAG: 16S rRNA (guanine(966)-N(2))-methyltransferase RsmD [Gammaproteobacteria bacterium]|nr:16S rRNA (guanine(966)-N(2))-methyltransferase RsmD [Gammaproteobacteria bacterium]